MANLIGPTYIHDGNGANRTQLNFYRYQYSATSEAMYIHLKTNIPTQSEAMYMIEAVGHGYAVSQPIRCAWTGYLYNHPSWATTVYGPAQFQAYPGLTAHGQYISSDGYLVLRAYSSNAYVTVFNLSIYQYNPSSVQQNVRILAEAAGATTSGAYL